MDFPLNCIKGVKHSSLFCPDGSPSADLFFVDLRYPRDDGWIEQSINWEDDNSVIDFTLNQKKEDGEIRFKAGVVIIPRNEIDLLSRQPTIIDTLSYERKKDPDYAENPYHGNILLKSSVNKQTMKKIAAGLALAVSKVIRQ